MHLIALDEVNCNLLVASLVLWPVDPEDIFNTPSVHSDLRKNIAMHKNNLETSIYLCTSSSKFSACKSVLPLSSMIIGIPNPVLLIILKNIRRSMVEPHFWLWRSREEQIFEPPSHGVVEATLAKLRPGVRVRVPLEEGW
jgi:hypothetical protein